MSYTWHFRHQTTGTKHKYIDRAYMKVIDRRIRDRMDKMTMNRLIHHYHMSKRDFVITVCDV